MAIHGFKTLDGLNSNNLLFSFFQVRQPAQNIIAKVQSKTAYLYWESRGECKSLYTANMSVANEEEKILKGSLD